MINTPPGKPTIRRDGDFIVVHIPMTFKRRGGRKEIIVPQENAEGATATSSAQQPMVLAVARGHIWRNLLESGKAKTIAEIARANKVDGSYVSRFLDLTLLAPDIVDAILDGEEPSGLSLTILTKRQIPLAWEEQRQMFGFSDTKVGR